MKNISLTIISILLCLGIQTIGLAQKNFEDGQKLLIKKAPGGSKMDGIELLIKANMLIVEKSSNVSFKVNDIFAKNIKVLKKGNGFVVYSVDLKNSKGEFEKKLFYLETSLPNQILGITYDCATVIMPDGTAIKDCAYGSDPTIIVRL